MPSVRQWFFAVVVLMTGGIPVWAAGPRENRDFTAAVSAFQDEMWSRAETELAQFLQKYPKSGYAAEAMLMEAEAEFKQGKFAAAGALLSSHESQAGSLADQYAYWLGQAQFENGDYQGAAGTFSRLVRQYPNSQWQLDAVVDEAASRTKLGAWPQVSALLRQPKGPFQQAAKATPADERVVRGQLLLAEALLAQHHADAASAVLQSLAAQPLRLALEWQRMYLLCRVQLAEGETDALLASTTNLLRLAQSEHRADWRAQSVVLQAEALTQLGRTNDAISAYQENLSSNAPAPWQREAVLKIADLAAAQDQFTNAQQSLAEFLQQFSNAPAADVALLTLGELHLKQAVAREPPDTEELARAQARFDQFIGSFTNSPLLGKAHLDRGWTFWKQQKYPESLADFKAAAAALPPSVDLAVARFKLGDAAYLEKAYAVARENYRAVLKDFAGFPAVAETLGDRALYQSLRASLELKDEAGASNALAQILKHYPANELAASGALLYGQSLAEAATNHSQVAAARSVFEQFEKEFPGSPLRPQVALAIARTYERENDWRRAAAVYGDWVRLYATNRLLLPQVEYRRALATFQAGEVTNAFGLFTNFVALFPANLLAPVAQWWIGDYFFRAGNYLDAEKNYEYVFQNWPGSQLAYPARMMAGRAAMARQGYSDAIGYFTKLAGDTNCPPDLFAQALFAYGDAWTQMPSTDTNKPLANYEQAIDVFNKIIQAFPSSPQAALAWGRIGNCYLQLAAQDTNAFAAASNAYAQVLTSTNASVAARSEAQLGIGAVLEKTAALAPVTNQTAPLTLARDGDYDVFKGNKLRPGESPDPFWQKKAGLETERLDEALQQWPQAIRIYEDMINQWPPLRAALENRIQKIRAEHPEAVEAANR
ncbi:MAG: tetratricopeptide repeat protein [Verrucomicrobiota bacterium]|nr:tetratricopeptide repeat protein [Verrucomicrobiota bacterium]